MHRRVAQGLRRARGGGGPTPQLASVHDYSHLGIKGDSVRHSAAADALSGECL